MPSPKFSLYFSHSWRPSDVDLNLYLWGKLCDACSLLVDENVGPNPPYFINRIEEYIRRSDLFLAVLTVRDEEAEPPNCSKASLFEVRLAERARKPRLVLYERGCQFTPPEDKSEYVRYEVFDRNDLLNFGNSSADLAIRDWLGAVENGLKPRTFMFHEASLALLPGAVPEVMPVLKKALLKGGYSRIRQVDTVTTDFEVMNTLAGTGLLVADITVTETADVLAMAHALFVPTIRIARRTADGQAPLLPWYLRGHPVKGYDNDVVAYDQAAELVEPVGDRAKAMRDSRKPITSELEGRRFFERRRWKPHRIFVSHALKAPQRQLIDELLARLDARAIVAWEYRHSGESGQRWKDQLDAQLVATTHALVVVDDAFNDSDPCCHELDVLKTVRHKAMPNAAPDAEDAVVMLPFAVAGCQRRATGLRELHHESLSTEAAAAAEQMALKVMTCLRA